MFKTDCAFGYSATAPEQLYLLHPRIEVVDALKTGQLKQWKIGNGYLQCPLAETAMGRYKQLNSPALSL